MNEEPQKPPKKDPYIINAQPTKELFISILVRDVTVRDAIGDLLDNSVDSALRFRPDGDYGGLKVQIDLNVKEGFFKIKDNCGGLPVSVARDYAFRFGRPEGAEKTLHSVGVFGIGMKRALFRLGNKIEIEAIAQNSSFKMEVDVEEWKKEAVDKNNSDWKFQFSEVVENSEDDFPPEKRGTSITVFGLHPGVREVFESDDDIAKIVEELQKEHLYSIDKGMEIRVNKKKLEATELQLLDSIDFKTAYWEQLEGPVKVKIYAGVSEKEKYGLNGGWYIFCNKRLVLGPDQTKTTGWGVKTPIRIPEYHSQFYRFRGYVFLDAEDPRGLPWNTAKTNMDLDSPIYKSILQKMIQLMRSVIDFLNHLHDEESDFQNERIDHKPLDSAINKAKPIPLNKISKNSLRVDSFVFPSPAPPSTPQPEKMWVRYSISQEEYEKAKEYFESDKVGEIGRQTFDYFWVREIED